MEGSLSYANFRAWVPRNLLSVGTLNPQDWVYYDWGPRRYAEPLVCLHPVIGSAESFHLQLLALADRGYRVIAPQVPVYWSAAEFCDGFHMFLDMLRIRRVHLYGGGLGAFLALQYSSRRPERVVSLALTHAFLSTSSVEHTIPYSPAVLRWLPDFFVRAAVRGLCPKGTVEVHIAEAAEFSIQNTIAASRDELASRLAILVTPSTVVGRLHVSEDRMTRIDVVDSSLAHDTVADEEMEKALPNTRRALLKSGGDYPFLGNPDEVSMHLVVHLRRNAAPPAEPLPQPPPARPLPVVRRRGRSHSSALSSEKDDTSGSEAGSEGEIDGGDEEAVSWKARAEEIVAAADLERNERFAPDVADLRSYLPDCEEDVIVAALDDCEGDADRAVAAIRDGQYSKRYAHKLRRRAVRAEVQKLRLAAGAAAMHEMPRDDPVAPDSRTRDTGPTGATVVAADGDHSGTSAHADLLQSGEGNSQLGLATVSLDTFPGGGMLDSHGFPAPIADTGSVEAGDSFTSIPPTGDNLSEASPSPVGSSRSRRGNGLRTNKKSAQVKSMERYPPDANSMEAYWTSEKVGMRGDLNLIGRSPKPIADLPAASTETSTPVADEEDVSAATDAGHGSSLGIMMTAAGTNPVLGAALPTQKELEGGSLDADTTSSLAADDGWGAFRNMDTPSASTSTAPAVADPSEVESGPEEDVEAARLREWMMSAQSAQSATRPRT